MSMWSVARWVLMKAVRDIHAVAGHYLDSTAPLLSQKTVADSPSAISLAFAQTKEVDNRLYAVSEVLSMLLFFILCVCSSWELRDVSVAAAFVDILLSPGRTMFSQGAAVGWRWFLPPAKLRVTPCEYTTTTAFASHAC
jgi:hypothetical protein